MRNDYGLELNNNKVGRAFSLPRSTTCINATNLCKKLCYGNGIRYQSKSQKAKCERNFKTCEFLLDEGGPDLLAENLSMLVEQARPRDWLTARVTGRNTNLPWTLRIHDIGDFYSVDYAAAWNLVVLKYDQCSFWFYTRSFLDEKLLDALTALAALQNCQGWLSIDSENYESGMLAKCKAPAKIWKLALLQDKDLPEGVVSLLEKETGAGTVSFPYHRGGRNVVPLRSIALTVCPTVLGSYELQTSREVARPCQLCTFRLPT